MLILNDYYNLNQMHKQNTIHPGMQIWVCNGRTARKPPHLMILGNQTSWPNKIMNNEPIWPIANNSHIWRLFSINANKYGKRNIEIIQQHTLLSDNYEELLQAYYQQLMEQKNDLSKQISKLTSHISDISNQLHL